MTQEDIPGWFDYGLLYDRIVAEARDGATLVEVGCWLGRSVAHLAQRVKESSKRITVWAVDHGFGTPSPVETPLHAPALTAFGGNVMGRLVWNLRELGLYDHVCPLIVPSLRAAKLFEDASLDFVFLDAAHDFTSVTEDLHAWWPKIRVGGTLAGHDYDQGWTGVRQAVNQFFGPSRDVQDPTCPSCWSVTRC